MSLPLVMVSSVVEGFENQRQAARIGIEKAGCRPILVNEDATSTALSSRNLCLDSVWAADLLVLVIGARGGWLAPSGKTVVREEYEEAKRLGKPILVFLQNCARDPEAETLARDVSDYVRGTFRQQFDSAEDLATKVAASVQKFLPSLTMRTTAPSVLTNFLSSASSPFSEASLRIAVTPSRADELFSPVELGSDRLATLILQLAHSADVGLLHYSHSTTCSLNAQSLIIESRSERSARAFFSFNERGHLMGEFSVSSLAPSGSLVFDAFVVREEDLEQTIEKVLRFQGLLFDELDPHLRHTDFLFNCGLRNLRHQSVLRGAVVSNSRTVRSTSPPDLVTSYAEPRIIARSRLLAGSDEALRAATLLGRNSK